MTFEEAEPFQKDLKRLAKDFNTIRDDLQVLKKVLRVSPESRPPISIELNGLDLEPIITKVNKMPCRSLPGQGANTGLKIIYAYYPKEERIVFIELFFKGYKNSADLERIIEYIGNE